MRYRLLSAYLSAGVAVCAWCAGCSSGFKESGPVVVVSGKVTNQGQPLEVKPDGKVEVVFTPAVEKGEELNLNRIYRASVDAQGNFKLTGNLGQGISPGKYRVAVYQWEPAKVKPGERPPDVTKGMRDLLQRKFAETTSKIIREITAKTTSIEIDISKPEG